MRRLALVGGNVLSLLSHRPRSSGRGARVFVRAGAPAPPTRRLSAGTPRGALVVSFPLPWAGYVSCVRASSAGYGPLADVRSGARAVCPGLVLTRSGPRRAPSGEWRPAGRASGPALVGGPVRRRAPVRPRPGPSGCVRPRPGPDLPSGAPSGTGLVASMLASARGRAPSGAKFPRPEVSVGRPVRRRRPDRTSGRGPSGCRALD